MPKTTVKPRDIDLGLEGQVLTTTGGQVVWADPTSGGEGEIYPGGLYTLGLFNQNNAFVDGADTSQGNFGLMDAATHALENNNFNVAFSNALVSGITPLTRNVISRNFSSNVTTIQSGRFRTAVFMNSATVPQNHLSFSEIKGPYATFSIDQVGDNITSAVDNTVDIGASNTTKGVFVTSGGNNYMVIGTSSGLTPGVRVYNTNVAGTTIGSLVSSFNLDDDLDTIPLVRPNITKQFSNHIVGTNGSNVFVVSSQIGRGNDGGTAQQAQALLSGYILNISSLGVVSLVNKNTRFVNGTQNEVAFNDNFAINKNLGSCVVGSTSYIISLQSYWFEIGSTIFNRIQQNRYITVNLSNIVTFSPTIVATNVSAGSYGNGLSSVNGNYTNYELTVGFNAGSVVYTKLSDFAGTYTTYTHNGTTETVVGTSFITGVGAYLTNKLTSGEHTTQTNTSGLISNTVFSKATVFAGTFPSSLFIFKYDGVNNDETAFVGIWVGTTVQDQNILTSTVDLSLSVNGQALETKTITLNGPQTGNRLNTTGPTLDYVEQTDFTTSLSNITLTVPATKVNFLLSLTNSLSRDLKMGFGATGGTYAAPTISNSLTGNATTAWTVTANGSFVSLDLA